MSFTPPSFVCELALGYNPGDSAPVYTDVSTYLRSFHITRGRQYELNQMQAGTCDITLNEPGSQVRPDLLVLAVLPVPAADGARAGARPEGYSDRRDFDR